MNISVVVPISPIKSHPDTSILEETVASVRRHLPSSELFLTFDGVRAEQEDRREAYEEAIQKILWHADHDPVWGPCVPFVWDEHLHQVGMLRRVIETIETPLLAFIEQDCPLVCDELIPWGTICDFILSGDSNLVRLSHESQLLGCHSHMHHGTEHAGLFTRTSQFSARPHIASVAYYRRFLESYFSPDAKCFTEDVMHGVVDEAYKRDGLAGWMQHRLHIYTPEGNIKRSYHLDGRAGEAKFDGEQVF